jgi:SAM-dependent methyltransferase
MEQGLISWSREFSFRGKKLFYNRIPFNNRAERAVEVPIAFDFLGRQESNEKMLEVGNTLQYYENALSDVPGVRHRRIVDKFEVGPGISNIDIMDIGPEETYQTIVSISTVEHVGQHCSPTGKYGVRKQASDFEAPLKAIAKIYDLLAPGGHALLTVPFGRLTDGGWYIQFSKEYLELLVTSYGIPREALAVGFLKYVAIEPKWSNPRQVWVETQAEELEDVRYDNFWSAARAIAVIEMTKVERPFALKLMVAHTALDYQRSRLAKGVGFLVGVVGSWWKKPHPGSSSRKGFLWKIFSQFARLTFQRGRLA